MNFLQKLAGGIDTTQALHSLLRQEELWEVDGEIAEIPLRAPVEGKHVNFFSLDLLPHFRQFTFGIMARIEGEELHTVALVKIPAGQESAHYASAGTELYFLTIQVAPGVSVQSHMDGVMLAPGDVWWSRGAAKFINNSSDDFIALVLFAVPSGPGTYVPELKL